MSKTLKPVKKIYTIEKMIGLYFIYYKGKLVDIRKEL